jgi:hypothetical protein
VQGFIGVYIPEEGAFLEYILLTNNLHLMQAGSDELKEAFLRDGYQLAMNIETGGNSSPSLFAAMKQFYSLLDSFIEMFLKNADKQGKPAHCRKGCAWCCHQAVFAQTHEFQYLKNWMFKNLTPEILDTILERSKQKSANTVKLSADKRLLHKEPCPLLFDDACVAYEARPVACRIYLSMDLDSCIHEFSQPDDKSIFPDLFEIPLLAGRSLNRGFTQRLEELGYSTKEYGIEDGLLK